MILNKYKVGDLITQRREKNSGEELPVKGVSREGFINPKQKEADKSMYNIFYKNDFVFNPARMEINSIALNLEIEKGICSSLYEVFYVKRLDIVLPEYLNLFIKRNEFAKMCEFNSWGSAREYFRCTNFNDIYITLPSLVIQQKYVDIYKSLIKNQKAYENGLNDLKSVCDLYIDNLNNCEKQKISKYIERNKIRNQEMKFAKNDVKGFNNEGDFIKPMRLFSGDISTFKIIKERYFVYNSRINSTIKKMSIAFNENEELIVSPAYESFYVKNEMELEPYYLYMLLQREIFAKKVLFNSFGSSTLVFGIDNLGDVEIPVPDIKVQQSLAHLYEVYKKRYAINEKLKQQIKDICPILIKGSLEEA